MRDAVTDLPLADVLAIAATAATAALAVAVLGAVVLRLLRGRSVVALLMTVVAVSLGTVLAGAFAASKGMFLSSHDLGVLGVVLVVTAPVGLLTALWLARALVRGSRALGLAALAIGAEGTPLAASASVPAELAAVSAELAAAGHRLDEARQRERALEASRRELVGWVSHDLRTPLAGLRAMAEALEDGVVDDPGDVARYHRQMRIGTDRLSAMVEDLFELSRLHAGTLGATLAPTPLRVVLDDVLAVTGPLARARGIFLDEHVLADPSVAVAASVPHLSRALVNLVVNAIRHTPGDGSVSVQAGASDGGAWVSVSDGCGGIPEADLPRLFDVGFRGDQARTPGRDGGAGLGLAIAQGLVQAHHGEVSVANVGGGCRFVVRLPLLA